MKKLPKLPRSKTVFPLILVEIIVGIAVATAALLVFADLSRDVLSEEILLLDHFVSRSIYAYRTPLLTQIMLGVTFFGGSIMLLCSSLALFLFLIWKKYNREALFFLFTFFMGVALNLFIKYVVARARPDIEPLIEELFYSYPSGHSMNSLVFYALLAYLMYHFTRNTALSVAVVFLSFFLILAIGISRIYLGVHYPSDVVGGYLVGGAWFLTALVISKTLTYFKPHLTT